MSAPLSSSSETLFQSLPFRTPFHGTTDIHENFTKHTTASGRDDHGDALLHNRFRGRTLIGVDVTLPPEYGIAVIDFSASSTHSPMSVSLRSGAPQAPVRDSNAILCADDVVQVARSQRYRLWEHDRTPDPHAAAALNQWIDLAAAIHSVDVDEDVHA